MNKISKELIENYRKFVLPFVSNRLYKTNFEGQGETDKTEFEHDFNEILDLAISALNRSGDLISRSALLNQIDTTDWSDVRLLVEDAPTVEPKKPHGKWVLVHPLQENDEGAYMCSACRTGDWCISPEFKFCPYCGAEMDGGNAE